MVDAPGPKKCVALAGTLDTKTDEIRFLRDVIERRGHEVLVIDTGILGSSDLEAGVTRAEVACEGGSSIDNLRRKRNEIYAQQVMAAGLKKIVHRFLASRRIHGFLAIGGGQGSTIVAPTLKSLELGFPKLLVSTKVTQAGARPFIGSKDVVIVPPVADLAGINRLTRAILTNAAAAMIGMIEMERAENLNRPLVVISMNGVVTDCGLAVKGKLENDGYAVLVFHTVGTGGEALEDYVASHRVAGVIELGVNEIGNELLGGMASAGPSRLESAGRCGVPQVVVPGSADFINFLGPETVPEKYKDRKTHRHNPQATVMRTNVEENRKLGEVIAVKLNRANGPVVVLWPNKGLSSLDCEGKPFFDPESDRSLLDSLKRHLDPRVPIREFDLFINDVNFADIVYKTFQETRQTASEQFG